MIHNFLELKEGKGNKRIGDSLMWVLVVLFVFLWITIDKEELAGSEVGAPSSVQASPGESPYKPLNFQGPDEPRKVPLNSRITTLPESSLE